MRPVVIAAGGTGGHFFPAEALAGELIRRGRRIVLMTDTRSAGLDSPVFTGQERYILPGHGVFGHGPLHALRALLALAGGSVKAWRLLGRLEAAVVVGFGGYPAVAPVLGARLLGRRRPAVVLHDQNAVLGRANRMLARFADRLALSHAGTAHVRQGIPAVVTGNPVRPAVLEVAGHGYEPPDGELRLLVLGGSLGARVFSDIVPAAVALLPGELRARLLVTQQCRPEDLVRVRTAYAEMGIRVELACFFTSIAGLLERSHLVISRGGGSTVAELAAVGRPAIIVPLPIAIDDDQGANARALVEAGGAWMVRQPEFTPDALAGRIAWLAASPALLQQAARAAASCAITDAAVRLADLVEQMIARDYVA